jgi:lysophospholipase L1-like esterase
VLLAGTNNIGNATPGEGVDARIEDITKGIEAIVRVIEAKAPNAVIVMTGIFPRNDNVKVMLEIDRINSNLARLAEGKKLRYLNINAQLADSEGKLFEGMMNADGLHPAVKGYQVWADALKPIFTEVLGPHGESDHAPLPTGDPSAQHP